MAVLAAVVEHRGFAPAAAKLRLSPSAVTRAVAALERELGVRLLHRTTRSVALTDAGAAFLERARRILSELGEAEAEARAVHTVPAGRLVVAAPSTFGRLHVAPLVADFAAAHPAVRVELLLADRIVSLLDEGVDVAVRIGALEDSSLRVRPVGSTRRVLVASEAYLRAHGAPRTPDDLREHRTIRFTSLTPLPEWTFVRRGREVRVPADGALATNDAGAALTLAERGLGIALLLSYQASESIRAGRLQVLLPRLQPPPIPIQIVHPGARHPPASVRAFIDLAAARAWSFDEPPRAPRARGARGRRDRASSSG